MAEGMRGAAGEELARGKAAATDADRFGADGPCGGDVTRGVADDDHAARAQRQPEDPRAARGADAQDLAALLVIAAETPEAEALEDAERPELRARAGADVSRAEADGDGAARGGRVERLVDPRVQPELRRLGDFGLQKRNIGRQHGVDGRFGVPSPDRLPDRGERAADDRAVGHAVEHHVAEHGGTPIPHREDALEGAATDPGRRHEGAIDVEAEDRRIRHGPFRLHAGPLEVDQRPDGGRSLCVSEQRPFRHLSEAPPFNGRSDAPAPNEATSAEPASRTASDRSYAARKFSMNSRSAATNRARRVRRSVSGSRIRFPARRSAASRARPRLSSRARVSSNHPSRTPRTTRGSPTPRNTAFADMRSEE